MCKQSPTAKLSATVCFLSYCQTGLLFRTHKSVDNYPKEAKWKMASGGDILILPLLIIHFSLILGQFYKRTRPEYYLVITRNELHSSVWWGTSE